jgi:phosphatidylinositol 4-kinase
MDLKPSEKNTLKFHMCFKLLKKCQKILLKNEFDNPKLKLIQSATNNSTALLDKASNSSKNLRLKVNENVVPAFLGIGLMLAGFGAPKLAIDSSKMAIIEGSKSLNVPQTNNVPQSNKKSTDGFDKEAESPLVTEEPSPLSPEIIKYVSPSLEELSMGRAFVGDRPWSRASHSREVSGKPSRAFQEAKESIEENQLSLSDSESQTVGMVRSPSSKRQTYYQSEIHFILSLMEISNRLCKVPKSSRQDSLQAELALLNYNLPADICLPLWCKATQHHHKVVRISPKDSVTLNSADRVPYLVFIEVFEENKGVEVEKSEEQKLPVPLPYSNSNSPNPNNQESNSPSRQNKNYFQKVLTRRSSNAQDEVAEHMRTAAIMLAQLAINSGPNNVAQKAKSNNQKMGINERIREKIIREMSQLEEKRIEQIIQQNEDLQKIMSNGGEGNENESVNEKEVLLKCKFKDDPSADVFNEDWDAKRERIRLDSPYGDHPNWELIPLIVKTGADLRQEQFALQLIEEADRIWKESGLDIFVKPFRIMVTSNSSGLIEMVRNTISVHSLKKNAYSKGYNTKGTVYTLYDHFVKVS